MGIPTMADLVVIRAPSRVEAARAAMEFVAPPDEELGEYCEAAIAITKAKMSFVTFVFENSHFVIAERGLDPADGLTDHGAHGPRETLGAETASICAYVVASGVPLSFEDTHDNPILEQCLAIKKVRSYSGAPVQFQGEVVGAFGIADYQPRKLKNAQMREIISLANQISQTLKAREP